VPAGILGIGSAWANLCAPDKDEETKKPAQRGLKTGGC